MIFPFLKVHVLTFLLYIQKIRPDQVILNSLISACGRAGALERAFDVLHELSSEDIPVEPNHITIGALIKACSRAGQVNFIAYMAFVFIKSIQNVSEVFFDFPKSL